MWWYCQLDGICISHLKKSLHLFERIFDAFNHHLILKSQFKFILENRQFLDLLYIEINLRNWSVDSKLNHTHLWLLVLRCRVQSTLLKSLNFQTFIKALLKDVPLALVNELICSLIRNTHSKTRKWGEFSQLIINNYCKYHPSYCFLNFQILFEDFNSPSLFYKLFWTQYLSMTSNNRSLRVQKSIVSSLPWSLQSCISLKRLNSATKSLVQSLLDLICKVA